MDKEALIIASIHFKYNSNNTSEQQALDMLEEIMLEMDEKFGSDVSIHIHERKVDDQS